MIIESRGGTVYLSGLVRGWIWPPLEPTVLLLLEQNADVVVDCGELLCATAGVADAFVEALRAIEESELPVSLANLPAGVVREIDDRCAAYLRYIQAPPDAPAWWRRLFGES
jgi:hypothetical protein